MATINLPSKFLNCVWSEKPNASTMQDEMILVTDVGVNGTFFVSNGSRWQPVGGQCLLASNTSQYNKTGYVGEEVAVSVKIPGGLMSTNGQLEILHLTSHTNNANTKRLRIRHFDSITAASGGSYYSASFTTSNSSQAFTYIKNDNSMTAQFGHSAGTTAGFGSSGVAGTTGAMDTNLDSYILFNVELTNASDFVALEAFWITYLEG